MEFYEEALRLLNEYLGYLQQEKSLLDNVVDYWIPILSAILLISSSVAAVIRYYIEKNRDLNEKILNEVYAPLYQYIIKQEYIRHLNPEELPYDKYPILSVNNTKTKITNMFTLNQKTTEERTDIFKNTDLLEVKNNLNFGLAPKDLLVLLNSYEMALHLINNVSDAEFNKIETNIRKAIISGYDKYKKKLGLKGSDNIIEYKDDEVVFKF